MPAARFDFSSEALTDLQKVQRHLQSALGVKLSRTKSIERALHWLASQLDAGTLTQADLAEFPQAAPAGGCSLCGGSGTIGIQYPNDDNPTPAECPRCTRR